ncbi:DUF317 domain-containing protein [Streptomyces maoxianensis]|uniref:DUF317 domain-containing protein n=1 Tax=Streptomyces maoxianensis TaxID=1459942 RepID=A0ABV9G4A1_9ACTN
MENIDPDALEPGTEVLVGPGYLAGPGNGRAVFDSLGNAEGWTKVVAFGTDTYYTSPCQRVRVANAVKSHYGGWTITFAEDPLGIPDWIVTFDRHTPDEVVAAFTATLVQGLPNHFADYLTGGKHYTGASPATVFGSHQWEAVPGSRPFHSVSPDGHAAYQMRVGWLHEYDELLAPEKSMWRMSAGVDPVYAPSWQAYFSRYTPQHLLTASAVAFTDPTFVGRAVHQIPERHRSLVDVHLPESAEPAPRTAAALARSSHAEGVPDRRPATAVASSPSLSHAAGSRRQR